MSLNDQIHLNGFFNYKLTSIQDVEGDLRTSTHSLPIIIQ